MSVLREFRRVLFRSEAPQLGRFFKQKTAYEIYQCDWRSDVCSSDLVVNFGAGSYVLYAEVQEDGMIEADPEAYGDSFARPARLLPVEAKALVAAIDLIGEHLPQGSLSSVRATVVAALGADPIREGLQVATAGGDDSQVAGTVSRAIADRRLLEIDYYKENKDEVSQRTGEPRPPLTGGGGW